MRPHVAPVSRPKSDRGRSWPQREQRSVSAVGGRQPKYVRREPEGVTISIGCTEGRSYNSASLARGPATERFYGPLAVSEARAELRTSARRCVCRWPGAGVDRGEPAASPLLDRVYPRYLRSTRSSSSAVRPRPSCRREISSAMATKSRRRHARIRRFQRQSSRAARMVLPRRGGTPITAPDPSE